MPFRLIERGAGHRHRAPAGREADAEVSQLDEAVAQRRLLEIDETDAGGGAQVIAGAGVAVQQRVVRRRVEPGDQAGEPVRHPGPDRNVQRPGEGEERFGVGGSRRRPRGQRARVGRPVSACSRASDSAKPGIQSSVAPRPARYSSTITRAAGSVPSSAGAAGRTARAASRSAATSRA